MCGRRSQIDSIMQTTIVLGSVTLGLVILAIAILIGILVGWLIKLQREIERHKQSEADLIQRQDFLQMVMDATPSAIFVKDPEGRFLLINQACAEIYGNTLEEAIGKRDIDFNPNADEIEQRLADNRQVIETRQSKIYSAQPIKHKTGETRWYKTMITPLIAASGQVQGIIGSSTNITELIHVEEALRQSEAQTRTILSAIPDLMFRANGDGIYLGYIKTDKFSDLMTPALQPIGRSVTEILPPALAQKRIRSIQQVLKTQEMQIYEQALWLQGQLREEEVRIVVSGENEVLVMIRNISTRKQAERQLLKKNKELAEALEQLTLTQQGLIQSEKLAALGQLIAGIAHEINTPLGAIRAASGNTAKALEGLWQQLPQLFQRLSAAQQSSFFALLDRASQQNSQSTAREKREWRRSLTEELETYEIGNAHAIADTLIDIGIYDQIEPFLGLLQDDSVDFTLPLIYNLVRLQGNSRNIAIAVERAAKVVFALKNYARYDHQGQKILAQLTDGLETVLTLYQNQLKQGVEVIRHYEPLPPILCYPDELNQVWTNLIHNAIQAMRGKGTLEISVNQLLAPDPNSPDVVLSFAVVSITDNGSGIPSDVLPRIFEPFFTTKPTGEGSGLGLDISRKIIDRHAGQITVESQPGLTTFQVWLPKA